ncbi:hypothetical protein C8J57DRAFT_1583230 [Mycena rebaudengoi]|nr:hypothetical protein C8J57DRAFT_1583230 [Mycena rebaudengoi]
MAHAQSKILPTSTRHHSTVEQSSQDKENAQPRTTSSSHQGRQRDAAAGKANTSPRAGLDDEDLSDTENQDVDDRHRQSADDDEDESHHRRSRPRRASEKEAQRIEEKEAADARKHEKHAKAAKAAKKKELQASGQNDNDENLAPRRDDVFTSRTVPSRPTATKNLAQRNSRILPPPQFSEDRRPTQGGAGSVTLAISEAAVPFLLLVALSVLWSEISTTRSSLKESRWIFGTILCPIVNT